MPETKTADPARWLPALLLLFAGSGASALIYEIVWYQELQLAIGSTAVSLGVLLATYMGGLCLGSWWLPRYLTGQRAGLHPLKVYAYIEFGIGGLGLLELVLIPVIDKLYVAGFQSGAPGTVLRAVFCAIALLPPTILMGASLPAIARWAQSSPRGASWWGLLYGLNIAGAVAGSLVAGFFLLRLYDVIVATVVAAAINAIVGGLSLWLASKVPAQAEAEAAPKPKKAAEPTAEDRLHGKIARGCLLGTIAASGAVSMGAQVVWTRIAGLMLGGTVYVFSIILAVFLIGLGIGAAAGSWAGRKGDAKSLLGWSQVAAALGLAWTGYQLGASLPYWPISPLSNTPTLVIFQTDLVRVLWATLPATIFWGASVPLAFAAAASTGEDGAKTVGGVYAANTLGAIVGALVVSLVLIPGLGTQHTEQILLALSCLAAVCAFSPGVLAPKATWRPWAGVATAAVSVCLLAPTLAAIPGDLIAYGRRTAQYVGQFVVLESHEGKNSSIAITRWWEDGSTQFHVQGKVEASDNPNDMALQRMLGYLPALFLDKPKSVLIVGFGAGVTAGTFTAYPSIERIKICEMEPLIPPTTTKYFGAQNHNVLHDRRTDITYDDARHYILTTREKFDIITSDPIHPFVKGSASLYSLEYFQMLHDHLNEGGVVTQWIPLYESDFPTVMSELATFMKVFPYAEVFTNNTLAGQGYDVVLVGHKTPLNFDPAAAQARMPERMAADMTESGLGDAAALFGRYVADKPGLASWLKGAQINRDRDLRLQYLAGFALNRNEADPLYREMQKRSNPPVGIRTANGFASGSYSLSSLKP